jgi:hypothetical protein
MKLPQAIRPARRLAQGLAAWSALALALPASGLETAEEIRRCVQDNLPERTSRQQIELTSEDRAGGRRTLEARLYWKREDDEATRVHIRVESPVDLRDSTYLVIEKPDDDEMFMYLPRLQKVRRITSGMLSDQLWGTDFSYEDIKQLQGITVDGASERLPDTEIGGRPAWVLAIVPSGDEPSSYERIVSAVDRETCVTLRTEFFERGDTPRKVLEADPEEIRRVGERWVGHRFEMRDVRDQTRSWLVIRKIANDVSIPANLFNPTLLGRSR